LFGPGAGVGGGASVPKAITNADSDWFQALGVLPAAMFRAVSPVTPPEQREGLLGLLSVCAASGLVTPGGRLRLAWSRPTGAPGSYEDGQIVDVDGRRVAILDVDTSDNEIRTLEFAPDGRFAVIPGYAVHREEVVETGRIARERVEAFVALARERGPVAWGADRPAEVSVAAGMSRAEATVLLAGVPDQKTWTASAPEGATGEAYTTAIQGWDNRPRVVTVEAYAALLPDDPAALWDAGPDVARLASWWAGRNGARRPVDDELIVAVHKAHVPSGMSASELLHGLANPATCRWLAGSVEDVSDDDVLVSVVKAVPWLAYRLPATHPVRAALPEVVELARRRVTDPGLLLDIGYLEEKKIPAFTAATGAPVRSDDRGIDAGAVFFPPDEGWRQVQLRPAKLAGAGDPVFDLIAARLDDVEEGPVAAVRALLGNQLADWVSGAGGGGDGGAEHDPSRSAPELVAEVAKTHGLGADAATIYLQLLALPDPTDRNIAAWTGWKPARLKAARAELAATDLVVDAKRTRAGRTLFLPGGWLALRAPHLPLETWKQPLLVGGSGAIDGLGMVIPVAPVPRLFGLAWARVTAGDPPRFDTLVTNTRTARRR
jgi:hypothetical protein